MRLSCYPCRYVTTYIFIYLYIHGRSSPGYSAIKILWDISVIIKWAQQLFQAAEKIIAVFVDINSIFIGIWHHRTFNQLHVVRG